MNKNLENQQTEPKKAILPVLKKMQISDVETFPINRYSSIRAASYTVDIEYDKKFSINADRVSRTVIVTRIK